MTYKINIGDPMPSFVAKDQDGNKVDSKNLLNEPIVIYFYPKDDTPGCTIEACSFRDKMSDLSNLGVDVIGVSPDSMD